MCAFLTAPECLPGDHLRLTAIYFAAFLDPLLDTLFNLVANLSKLPQGVIIRAHERCRIFKTPMEALASPGDSSGVWA